MRKMFKTMTLALPLALSIVAPVYAGKNHNKNLLEKVALEESYIQQQHVAYPNAKKQENQRPLLQHKCLLNICNMTQKCLECYVKLLEHKENLKEIKGICDDCFNLLSPNRLDNFPVRELEFKDQAIDVVFIIGSSVFVSQFLQILYNSIC